MVVVSLLRLLLVYVYMYIVAVRRQGRGVPQLPWIWLARPRGVAPCRPCPCPCAPCPSPCRGRPSAALLQPKGPREPGSRARGLESLGVGTAAETSEREGGRSKGLTRDRSKGFTRDHSGSLNRFHCRRGTVAAVALSAGSCCSCCNCGQRGRLRCAVAAVGGDRSHGFVEDRREKREKTEDFAARPNLGQAQ